MSFGARLKLFFFRFEFLERVVSFKVKFSDNGLKVSLGRSKVGFWGGVWDAVRVRSLETGSR